jgi:hypothetical protein
LTIPRVHSGHAGSYQCTASNLVGQISSEAKLLVLGAVQYGKCCYFYCLMCSV